MVGILLRPPNIIEVAGPLIFLAGPIQGAPDWQSEAIQIIREGYIDLHIASPRKNYREGEFVYAKQVDWETHYLGRAAENGAIMFWLAKEQEHDPERAYAQTSRFELGEWKVRHELNGTNLVVGIEEGFTNERYIRRRLSQDCPDVKVPSSLEETCLNAIKLCKPI